ncbi:hypothetical protein [Candidatus Nitrosocosmicus hydrocola]|uniref:hypothetical protein n=1 Tax=Candidatus Nitrosocosmicus hydrocola TaxID=1826872 RepID=UPI0011E5DDCA|nr:hypothetical protein [Candidatus Nitrosocosmicus hydrocola]
MLISILPIILIFLSGYAVGRIIARICKSESPGFVVHFLYGNIIIMFIFISLFIFLGVLSNNAQISFLVFNTFLLVMLAIDLFYLIKFLNKKLLGMRNEEDATNGFILTKILKRSRDFPFISVFIIVLALTAFNYVLISYHSIYNEYDSLYIFLPISHSILLGNGLNVDYFGGSDESIKYPPLIQSLNAWILNSFNYDVLRTFPIYFILLTSISIYFISKRFTNDRFLPLIATSFYLLMPATFVISSRFSLQHDIAFVAFLTFSAFTLCNILYTTKVRNFDFIMFVVAISLLPLTREVGLIISWSLLFVLIAFKFSSKNLFFRILILVLAFIPIYGLTFYDIVRDGLSSTTGLRLTSLLLCNAALVFLSHKFNDTLRMRSLIRISPFLLLIIIPGIFIVQNLIQMNGPYPTLMFSSDFNNSVLEYRNVFDVTNKLDQSLIDSVLQLPRLDLLFIATALSSFLIFFKVFGFLKLLRGIRKAFDHHSFLLIFVVILLLIWSYFLGSNFKESGIRHISYFAPFLAMIAILPFQSPSKLTKLYILAVVAGSSYYVINFEVVVTYLDHYFNALWIDPFLSEIITIGSLLVGASIFIGYVIIVKMQDRLVFTATTNRIENSKLIDLGFIVCSLIVVFVIVSTNLGYSIVDITVGRSIDSQPAQWENNVTEVANFLKDAENGSVLGFRTPSVSFLTNRTNYDAFNPHTFGKVVLPILKTSKENLEEKINQFDIKYIIMPNENNPQHKIIQNMDSKYNLSGKLEESINFIKIDTPSYDIYKHINSDSNYIDIFNKTFAWTPVNVELIRSNSSLLMLSEVDTNNPTYNRIFLDADLDQESPQILYLNYTSEILTGNASFIFEIRDSLTNDILFSKDLGNTNGTATTGSIALPSFISDIDIELRFYVIPEDQGRYYLLLSTGKIYPL